MLRSILNVSTRRTTNQNENIVALIIMIECCTQNLVLKLPKEQLQLQLKHYGIRIKFCNYLPDSTTESESVSSTLHQIAVLNQNQYLQIPHQTLVTVLKLMISIGIPDVSSNIATNQIEAVVVSTASTKCCTHGHVVVHLNINASATDDSADEISQTTTDSSALPQT